MHNKAMEMAKSIMDKACVCGYDNLNSQDWDDFKDAMEVVEKAIKADYYYHIVEAMKKAEEEEEAEEKYMMKRFKEEYGEEEGEKRFYDDYRYKRSGRFAPKGKGSYMPRRGYDEPPYYHVMPEDMKNDPEWYRDMDREKHGKMYYTETMPATSHSDMGRMAEKDGMRHESRYDRARRGYTETKMSDDGTPERKKKSMESLDKYMKELADDMTELVGDMDSSEKAMLKSKLSTLAQKIQ